jgi:hypothetical protein
MFTSLQLITFPLRTRVCPAQQFFGLTISLGIPIQLRNPIITYIFSEKNIKDFSITFNFPQYPYNLTLSNKLL